MPGERPLHVAKRALAAELTGGYDEREGRRPSQAPEKSVQEHVCEECIHRLTRLCNESKLKAMSPL